MSPLNVNTAQEYEGWLQQQQMTLPVGSVLVTGLAGYVHYGPYYDGFRLTRFLQPLYRDWRMIREYDLLSYLPLPERARLWRLTEDRVPTAGGMETITEEEGLSLVSTADPRVLYDKGLESFEKGDYAHARPLFRKVSRSPSYRAIDAGYLYGVCLYRERDWVGTVREFENLLKIEPASQWTAASHWHIAMALRELEDEGGARMHFEYVIGHFPNDTPLVTSAKEALQSLPSPGLASILWDRLKGAMFE
jgi:hypothetical protein